MKNLLNLLIMTAKSRVMPLWTKLRLWTSPAFLRAKVLTKIREFFVKLLDVRPRNGKDYYGLLRWLVSKRLAFAIVVALGLCAAIYIGMMMPDGFFRFGADGIRTYRYRSLPLKFQSGQVNILARDGHLAYSGQVDGGAAEGQGVLYGENGERLYEGDFVASKFDGKGTLYYANGGVEYSGDFTENIFNGKGRYFRPGGVLEYDGDYVTGVRTGQGILYDSVGNAVYQGGFLNDQLLYSEFLDKPTAELAAIYTGVDQVYQSETEFCVAMPDIDAVCAVRDGSSSLENEWTTTDVYVLSPKIPLDTGDCLTINQVSQALGEPLYFGTAWVKLPEAVAMNLLEGEAAHLAGTVDIESESVFDEVFSVTGYDKNRQVYLYTFEKDGLLYTFYTPGAGQSAFFMYAISKP